MASRASPRPAARTGTVQERGGIQSVNRAVDIIDCVAKRPDGIGLAELSIGLGLNKSTAFHLIKTLEGAGLVAQNPETRRYRIGARLFALAAGALNERTLLLLATPILEDLSRETGDAAHLAVRDRDEIVVVARTEATGMLQLSGRTGETRPAHATAIGKMLLAGMPGDDLRRLLGSLRLRRFTANTITDRDTLAEQLRIIRDNEVAYDDREFDEDIKCVAVPVRDFAGRCAGAMGLSGPAWRLAAKPLREKSRRLRAAADMLSAQLGSGGGPA